MKTKLSLLCLVSFALCSAPLALSQVPQGFNYQAIARDGDGNLITDAFDIKFEIQNLAADTVFWIEEHNVTPNEYGLISFVVGQSGRIGGTATNFSDIDWVSRPRYLKTSAKYPGPGYTEMGTTQIWAVPYSLVAKSVETPLEKLDIKGTTTKYDEAIFEVRNNTGQTIFAVYDEGVRIYVDDGAKGVKGGFAIGGFGTDKDASQPYFIVKPDTVRIYIDTPSKGTKGGFAIGGYGSDKTLPQHYLLVSADSIRAYIDSTSAKGVKGGFAIGGFENTKAQGQQYLKVTRDSVRVYLDANPATKAVKGGFAIGGFDVSKGLAPEVLYLKVDTGSIKGGKKEYMQLSSTNTFIGFKAGNLIPVKNPTYNTFIGYESGAKNSSTIPTYNLFIGHAAGNGNTTGTNNVFLGYYSGYGVGPVAHNNVFIGKLSGTETTGSDNIFIGSESGRVNTSGNGNVFLGLSAGRFNIGGYQNLFLGSNAGQENTSGYHNVSMGYSAGNLNKTGNFNLYIGAQAGTQNLKSRNVCIGFQSGFSNTTGHDNLFIGYKSGFSETRSNKLIIDNYYNSGSLPLIWGDFRLSRVVIAGDSTNNLSGYNFFVNGSAAGKTVWTNTSDARLKKNIVTIPDALNKVMQLRGVNYEWIDSSVETGTRMGLIAQEVEKVVPEVVNTNGDYYSMQYAPLNALLIEAIKEQQNQINKQNERLDHLDAETSGLKSQIELLRSELEQMRSQK